MGAIMKQKTFKLVGLVILAAALYGIYNLVLRQGIIFLNPQEWNTLRGFPPRSVYQLLNQRDVSLKIAARHPAGVLLIWAAAYIGMQTFAIPGTISLSLLAGALWGVHRAAIVVAMVSTAGACSCYMLSQLIGRPLAAALWPGKLQSYGEEVAKRRAQLLNYIIFLRVTPLLPNTFVNVASPIVGVPLAPFALGTLLGCLPNNIFAVNCGSRLAELQSMSDLVDGRMLALGICVGILALAPVYLQARQGTTEKIE